MELKSFIRTCNIEGNLLKLPDIQLQRADYMEVKKALELMGGKWKGGKISAFVFPTDPTGLINRFVNGEKVNTKKEFQAFYTPSDIAAKMVELLNPYPEEIVLEPSAGSGNMIAEIFNYEPEAVVHYCELMDLNRHILEEKFPQAINVGAPSHDFLDLKGSYKFIIANPPFAKNQDIDHVLHMYKLLKPGGRLISIMSNHWIDSTKKKETSFRDFLSRVGAFHDMLPPESFKESGTTVSCGYVIIEKPETKVNGFDIVSYFNSFTK